MNFIENFKFYKKPLFLMETFCDFGTILFQDNLNLEQDCIDRMLLKLT